ncbi:intermediate filament family protein [Butyrivibrio hungatei]|uniref:Uncharacterized protein n=1 Tax=Butyrivibrio hungatei TaxID=185008 RepID=A0A1D9P2U7_9FIRM|nr:hypothetical protein [Butyrivibrio hungatei]AOZ96926.1 hypothetical protein bhn_I1893 [Butyrivibrio hungatei]
MALDVAIKDIPAATLSFASGQDIDTVLYNFGGALEADLVGNSIGEFVGIGFDAALSAVKSTIRETASEAIGCSCQKSEKVILEIEGDSLEKTAESLHKEYIDKISNNIEKAELKSEISLEAESFRELSDIKTELLKGEGEIGTYRELLDSGEIGDNITPHHMPSAEYMSRHGVTKKDGLCMNVEMPSPGKGGRHRLTRTYGHNMTNSQKQFYYSLAPREALAFDIRDMMKIYREQGLYKQIRPQLQKYIIEYENRMPELFGK